MSTALWSPFPLPPLQGQRLHLIGLCGRGMAPLAIMASALGAHVTGCDRAPNRDRVADLRREGIPVQRGHDESHAVDGVHAVATPVADGREAEVERARLDGLLHHRSDLLAAVLETRPGIGVTGSHGKGTVTALTAGALIAAGLDPLVGVGTPVPALGGIAVRGMGPTVVEVDDSDLTLDRVRPDVAVVTNLDHDHPHLSTTLADSLAAVGRFVSNASHRVLLGPSRRSTALERYARVPVWRVGRDVRGTLVSCGRAESVVRLQGPDGERAEALVRVVGPATGANTALAWAAALSLGADPVAAAAGIGSVDRLERRLEPLGAARGVWIFDDFGGKHPVNVREGIRALRRRMDGRVVAVFEPYGPYLPRWAVRYARALEGADVVVAAPTAPEYPVPPEADRPWWESCRIPVVRASSRDEAADLAIGSARPGDAVVVFAQVLSARAIAARMLSSSEVNG